MKDHGTPAGPGSPIDGLARKDLSRRQFLQSAAVAGVVAATVPIAGIAQSEPAERQSRMESPEEKILSRYGSEFGDLNRIG